MIRVRYVGTELCPEGVVEEIPEADRWTVEQTDDGEAIKLFECWEDDDGTKHKALVGRVAAGRWQSVMEISIPAE